MIDKCVELLIRRVMPGTVARRVASIARERYITAERAYALRVGGRGAGVTSKDLDGGGRRVSRRMLIQRR